MSRPLGICGNTYVLRLEELTNSLTGEDAARFEISLPPAGLSEAEKIERLLRAIAALDQATFLRNGEAHTAADAAAHLRTKYASQADSITSAAQFIDQVATRSSQSGESYLIRYSDGTRVELRVFLLQTLAETESGR